MAPVAWAPPRRCHRAASTSPKRSQMLIGVGARSRRRRFDPGRTGLLLAPSRETHEGGRGHVSADRIFISYRRADSGGWARSLHDKLDESLGAGRAFRDVAMPSGMDFHQHVESLLDRCDVLLAVIGKRWTSITDDDGNRRLDNPDDLVRREIARALQRADVHVIPVLVDGARMPTERELPPDLAPLSRRHACELSDSRWDYDVETLTRRLRELLGEKPPRAPRRLSPVWIGLMTAMLLGVFVVLWLSLKPSEAPPTKVDARIEKVSSRNVAEPLRDYLHETRQSNRPYTPDQLRQPGYVFNVSVRIIGRRGKKFPLRWSLYRRPEARIPGPAYNRSAGDMTPESADHTSTWPVWVPYPQRHGTYFVRFTLDDQRNRPVSDEDSPAFRYPPATGG
jgi:hypothetical protein